MQPHERQRRALQLRPDEYERWLAHPVTETFLGYLQDYAREVREQWFQGARWSEIEREGVLLREGIAGLGLEKIQEFYSEPSEETDASNAG